MKTMALKLILSFSNKTIAIKKQKPNKQILKPIATYSIESCLKPKLVRFCRRKSLAIRTLKILSRKKQSDQKLDKRNIKKKRPRTFTILSRYTKNYKSLFKMDRNQNKVRKITRAL